jgi:hypothetical protein
MDSFLGYFYEGFTDANSLNEPKFTVTLINPRVGSEIRLGTFNKNVTDLRFSSVVHELLFERF